MDARQPKDAYERFMLDLGRELKRGLVEPAVSIGEVIGLLAWMALKPAWWIGTPIILAWLIWRNGRQG